MAKVIKYQMWGGYNLSKKDKIFLDENVSLGHTLTYQECLSWAKKKLKKTKDYYL